MQVAQKSDTQLLGVIDTLRRSGQYATSRKRCTGRRRRFALVGCQTSITHSAQIDGKIGVISVNTEHDWLWHGGLLLVILRFRGKIARLGRSKIAKV